MVARAAWVGLYRRARRAGGKVLEREEGLKGAFAEQVKIIISCRRVPEGEKLAQTSEVTLHLG